ncbi:GAF and ANTAR domain-containing protein [Arthrobacter agilis]|uniref:GAF and ANTAR domain-containing protein n=1 Tax=Arthrobacter agilis TaxID=37921 RepID=UPI002785B7CD|nr:GAF and ANTAR domain-containing protein [Arthrobacter agilis]MDQ0734719.1 GAF domain-containing protein [Arthrobacter agilis]
MNTTPSSSSPDSAPPRELLAIFGRSNGYLLTEQTAHDAVNGLAEIARDIIGAATGAGVSIIDQDGTRISVGATNPDVLEADNLQYEFGQGPCMRAWSTGEPTYIPDTHTDDRFQEWTSAVTKLGIRSCLSVPLLNKPAGLGAMKVYSNTVDAFTNEDRRLLINLARSAAALLGHIQASDTPQRISDDVRASLAERDTIGVARGILMERFNLDRQAAMSHLIELATDANTTIGTMAAMISERQDGSTPSGDS